jgi:hypothetical protein
MADPPSLRSYNHCVVHGNVDSAMAAAPRTLTGEGRVGAQEHFYLEPHVVMAAPEEHRGEMTIYSCTQCVAKTVKIVAGCLGVQENKVNPLPPTAPTPSLNSLLTQLSAGPHCSLSNYHAALRRNYIILDASSVSRESVSGPLYREKDRRRLWGQGDAQHVPGRGRRCCCQQTAAGCAAVYDEGGGHAHERPVAPVSGTVEGPVLCGNS